MPGAIHTEVDLPNLVSALKVRDRVAPSLRCAGLDSKKLKVTMGLPDAMMVSNGNPENCWDFVFVKCEHTLWWNMHVVTGDVPKASSHHIHCIVVWD